MKNLNLPDCPYCRTELGYLDAFFSKNKSNHRCTNCGRISNVKVRPAVFRFFIVAEIVTIIAFVFAVIMGGGYCLLGLAIILLCSLVFYGFTPFTVALVKRRGSEDFGNQDEVLSKNKTGMDTDTEIYSN